MSRSHQKLIGGLLPLVREVDSDEDGDDEHDGEDEILLPPESGMKFGQSGKIPITPHFFVFFSQSKPKDKFYFGNVKTHSRLGTCENYRLLAFY